MLPKQSSLNMITWTILPVLFECIMNIETVVINFKFSHLFQISIGVFCVAKGNAIINILLISSQMFLKDISILSSQFFYCFDNGCTFLLSFLSPPFAEIWLYDG